MKEILNQIPIYIKGNFFLDLVTFMAFMAFIPQNIFFGGGGFINREFLIRVRKNLIRSIAVCYSFKI